MLKLVKNSVSVGYISGGTDRRFDFDFSNSKGKFVQIEVQMNDSGQNTAEIYGLFDSMQKIPPYYTNAAGGNIFKIGFAVSSMYSDSFTVLFPGSTRTGIMIVNEYEFNNLSR